MADAESGPAAGTRAPREIPALLIRSGRVYTPGPDGPEPARAPNGTPIDPFDAFDRLTPNFRRIYIADLNGIEGGEPQLDLWQELARESDLWIDGGVQTADQAIDILVSGARRAILSTGRLRSTEEVAKAWALSQELAVEIEVLDEGVRASAKSWRGADPVAVATEVRAAGPQIVILSPRGIDVDWSMVRRVAEGGTTYVAGSYPQGAVGMLTSAGARGGIFYPTPAFLSDGTAPSGEGTAPSP